MPRWQGMNHALPKTTSRAFRAWGTGFHEEGCERTKALLSNASPPGTRPIHTHRPFSRPWLRL